MKTKDSPYGVTPLITIIINTSLRSEWPTKHVEYVWIYKATSMSLVVGLKQTWWRCWSHE